MAEAPFTPKAPPADAAAETGLVHVEVEAVRFGGQDVPVGVLRLGRPARANAYTPAMLRALEAGLRRLEGEARALVVEAEGAGAFCGGADLGLLAAARPEDALDLLSQRVFSAISNSPLPSVAAVQGPAVAGGCELALACDLRVAGPAARFAQPETARGLVPAAGGWPATQLASSATSAGDCSQGWSWPCTTYSVLLAMSLRAVNHGS
jgi:enoyl-CoA hydratase/carnithine racemase